MMKQALPVIILFFVAHLSIAQPCTYSGHTPSSAILLCGANFYTQASIPICGQTQLPVPCNGSFVNMNPTWFKMTCFSSGTLGFIIGPHDPDDNFDWQLFDVSGRNNDDVFTDGSMFVACNWSPEPGETGASMNGNTLTTCSDAGGDLFSKMPNIIQGHEYLLLVSHRSVLASGFDISITGGTASVTDPLEPGLFNARMNCNGNQVYVLFNKKLTCTTIASDGSDFSINAPATILSAVISDCNSEGEANFVTLNLSNPVPAGNYLLSMQNGTDLNTVGDKCGRFITPGSSVPVLPPGTAPPLPDTLITGACSPDVLKITFRKPVQCSSIAVNGSDFFISGPQPATINNISFNCNTSNPQNPTTNEVSLHLATPLVAGGTFRITMQSGSDGNTIIDECGTAVPAGTFIPFEAKPSVSAAFTYTVSTSCRADTVRFTSSFPAGISSWQWNINGSSVTGVADPVKIFNTNGDQPISLVVSNGICFDTARAVISLNNKVTAAFEIPPIICPEDTLQLINQSSDNADRWQWNFGAGINSTIQFPRSIQYPANGRENIYDVRLSVTNTQSGCRDSIIKKVRVLSGCYIAVPTAFTPNKDGRNDWLQPLNALKAEKLEFRVYNRLGQLVFSTRDWTKGWDGTVNNIPQGTGVYVWLLRFTHRDTGENIFMKGTSLLIR